MSKGESLVVKPIIQNWEEPPPTPNKYTQLEELIAGMPDGEKERWKVLAREIIDIFEASLVYGRGFSPIHKPCSHSAIGYCTRCLIEGDYD